MPGLSLYVVDGEFTSSTFFRRVPSHDFLHFVYSLPKKEMRRVRREVFSGVVATLSVAMKSPASSVSRGGSVSRRNYWHTIRDDLVPEGEHHGPAVSHIKPSQQTKILKEYAHSPLFGNRLVATVIGTSLPSGTLLARKADIAKAIDWVLKIPEGSTSLGVIQLPRQIRSMGFLTTEKVARTYCDVYFPDEWNLEEVTVFGEELRQIIVSGQSLKLQQLGIFHAEDPPADDFEPTLSRVMGSEIEAEEREEIRSRWNVRVTEVKKLMTEEAMLRQLEEEEAAKKVDYLAVDPELDPDDSNARY